MEWITSPEAWVALITLTALEIVLGIDNIIFISVIVSRLPQKERGKARTLGSAFAMITRILLLLVLSWIMSLSAPLFSIWIWSFSARDLILILGGLFLLAKSTHEIHNSLEGIDETVNKSKPGTFFSIILQISLLDIIFSLDSVITAIGLAEHLAVMIIAIVIAVGIMMLAANIIGNFVDSHPTIKMLALSFLILVGVSLLGEGFDFHIPKGYIYFAMAFSFAVEMLNLKLRKKERKVVKLHKALKLSDEAN